MTRDVLAIISDRNWYQTHQKQRVIRTKNQNPSEMQPKMGNDIFSEKKTKRFARLQRETVFETAFCRFGCWTVFCSEKSRTIFETSVELSKRMGHRSGLSWMGKHAIFCNMWTVSNTMEAPGVYIWYLYLYIYIYTFIFTIIYVCKHNIYICIDYFREI